MSARRGIVLVLVLIVLAIFVSIAGSLLLLAGSSAVPSVPSEATLYLKIRAPFDEVEPIGLFNQFTTTQTLRNAVDTIRKAKADRRIKTLVIRPEASGALWGQLQEIRAAIQDFRKSGKPVTAFLEYGAAQEYYIASAADRVIMLPGGTLEIEWNGRDEVVLTGPAARVFESEWKR